MQREKILFSKAEKIHQFSSTYISGVFRSLRPRRWVFKRRPILKKDTLTMSSHLSTPPPNLKGGVPPDMEKPLLYLPPVQVLDRRSLGAESSK